MQFLQLQLVVFLIPNIIWKQTSPFWKCTPWIISELSKTLLPCRMAKQQSSGSNTNLLSTSLLAACWAQGRACSPQHMVKLHSESEMYQAGLQRQPNIWVSQTREAPVGSKFCLSARYVNQINCKRHGDFTLGASKQNFWPHHKLSGTAFTPRCNMMGREISSCLLACPRSVSPQQSRDA